MAQGGAVYDSENGQQYARNFTKNECGQGGGVIADGVMIRMSHTCVCAEWNGYAATRSVTPRVEQSSPRLERGPAALPAAVKLESGDWSTYRANPQRSASSSAVVAAKAAIRWTYLPPRSGRRPVGDGNWGEYDPDGNATQALGVGDRIWFGTAEGALVCLDRQTGEQRWCYRTTGRIMSAPTWYDGRLYAGSGDGWVYCLDAANGALIWRYRVTPSQRRLMVEGYLGSAWPVLANVLVHDDTAFVSAGLMSELGGSVFFALNARTGEPRWEKRNPCPQDTASKDLPYLPAANGQMALYGDRIWFKSSIYGPLVYDPASDEMKQAVDIARTINEMTVRQGNPNHAAWSTWGPSRGQDIGILPGGWVAMGGRQFFQPIASVNQPRNQAMFLNATAAEACKDAKGFPTCLVVARDDRRTDIPAWDANEAVVYFGDKSRFQLCRDFSKALTADAAAMVFDPKTSMYWNNGVRRSITLSLPPEQCRPVLPDDLQKAYGYEISSPVLAGNAVVYIINSQVCAVQRSDRKLLWDVELPAQPLPGGLSLTRSGDVLVPLVDGRIACIGGGEPAISPAEPAHQAQPGLVLQAYDFGPYRPDRPSGSQLPDKNLSDIPTAGEIAALKPVSTTKLPEFTALNQPCAHPTLVRLRGSIEVPETAVYRFYIDYKNDGWIRCTISDASRRFAEYSVTRGKNFHSQPRPLLLAKGKHPIEIIGYQLSGSLQMRLDWELAGHKQSPVPAEALWHDPSDKPSQGITK